MTCRSRMASANITGHSVAVPTITPLSVTWGFKGPVMRRRQFITLASGAPLAWPLAARAQQPERARRVGVLFVLSGADPESQARLSSFRKGLHELGWTDGKDIRIESSLW